ncbi:MAG: isoprenylcysteine carboxylmethyltransferase family protein [Gammaproteobacteria bacterium]|jgi:protein-S-isoprenylcysteine O-methyltransferase Ste14
MTPPRILPPHYFLLSLIGMIGLGLVDPTALLAPPWRWIGVLPVAAGIGLAIQGSRLFSKAGTNIVPFSESTALVTSGVFSLSRNPMYSGMMLVLIGTALLLNGTLPWLVIVPFFAIIRGYFIRHEEALMEQTFGEEYLTYKSLVRRWL